MDNVTVLLAAVERVRRRANLAMAAGRAVRVLAVGLLALGVLVVGVRLLTPEWAPWLLAGLLPVAAAAAIAALVARRDFWGREEAAAWLDLKSSAGGGILTSLAFPGAAGVPGDVAIFRPPRLAPAWFALRVLPAAAFLALSFLVPAPRAAFGTPPLTNPIAREDLVKIEDRIEELHEENVLSEETIEEMKKDLERIRAAQEKDPFSEPSLEAIDALADKVDSKGREGRHAAQKTQEALDAMEDALAEGAGEEDLSERRGDLEQAIREAAEKGALAGAPPELREALGLADKGDPEKYGKLPRDKESLAKALRDLKEHARTEWKKELAMREGHAPG
ncbi:MAG: hypothetical protein HY720_30545 [Planctomycetes bacterium]|nr:hypothetical protein [Planctomycetota bacterium]